MSIVACCSLQVYSVHCCVCPCRSCRSRPAAVRVVAFVSEEQEVLVGRAYGFIYTWRSAAEKDIKQVMIVLSVQLFDINSDSSLGLLALKCMHEPYALSSRWSRTCHAS